MKKAGKGEHRNWLSSRFTVGFRFGAPARVNPSESNQIKVEESILVSGRTGWVIVNPG